MPNRPTIVSVLMFFACLLALAHPALAQRGERPPGRGDAPAPAAQPSAPRGEQPSRESRLGDQEGDAERWGRGGRDGGREGGRDEDKPWDADLIITHHTVTIGGSQLAYTATAGRMPMPDYEGEHRADIFFIAYTLDGPADTPSEPRPIADGASNTISAPTLTHGSPDKSRPITFTFNGGPGSSSVWLHLGSLGPQRVELGSEGEPLPPPGRVVPNAESWLDFTDLVFIDPVSTGFSRPAEGVAGSEFYGLEQDIESVGEFIRLYVTRAERWSSPKFLCGESYGTTRAAGLSAHLQDRYGMYLNGITMVSSVLDFSTIRFGDGNDLPYIVFLPTYTAAAWYHGKLAGDLAADRDAAIRAAEEFARGDYARALLAGDDLPAEERARIAARLAELTGISAEFIDGVNLRITMGNFSKELLRDRRLTIGRFDARYTGTDESTAGTSHEYDPSSSAIEGAFATAINAYLREGLGYKSDHPYEILTGRVRPWDYSGATNRYVSVARRLRDAVTHNPALHVLFAGGYYDLATPHGAMDHTIAHLNLPEALRGNITRAYYSAGHMMYLRDEDRIRLHDDAAAMYRRALGATVPNPLGRTAP